MQCVLVFDSVLQYDAVCCSAFAQCPKKDTLKMILQCVAVCCSVLQCVAAHFHRV